MQFTTDKQTLEDLNIFGKHGKQSIYSIFNKTFTRGGAEIMEEMFRFPLADAAEINKRSSIIQSFLTVPVFAFDSTLFDLAEQYLSNTDERTRLLPGANNVSKKISNLIAEDADHRFVQQGLTGLIALLRKLLEFLKSIHLKDDHPYQQEKETMLLLLADLDMDGVLRTSTSNKLTYEELAKFDVFFRFRQKEALKKLLRYIYVMDVYFSVGQVAKANQLVFAQALSQQERKVVLEGVYHPHVKDAVSNTFNLSADHNIMFLTGANMAGKSTFMKSVGVAMFLAHMGFPVPAKRMTFSVMDGIYTTINLPDNLGMGTSHFYAEVLRVKKIATALHQSKNLFVIIDELFRGTNVKDAYEATIALTSAFAGVPGSTFIISTHIIEAGEVLKQQHPNMMFNYLPTLMDGNRPVYTYTLDQGITADRHGMIIIQNEGILEILENGLKTVK